MSIIAKKHERKRIMRYKEYKGKKVSTLGMGCMRLPKGEDGKLDEAESIRIIRHAIDQGVTYVDTAFTYPGSEKILGKALQDGYREKVVLADKMPGFLAKEPGDIESMFNKQMERLGTDHFDFYLVHNISRKLWKISEKYNTMDFLKKKKEEGVIDLLGFSYHDDYEFFEEMLDKYEWDFVQIQLNYVDTTFQAGLKGLELAASKGIPVVIMEPLKGGRLASKLPPQTDHFWEKMSKDLKPVEWAFRWVANRPEVLTILSGMSSYEQLDENLRIFDELEPGCITEEDEKILYEVADTFRNLVEFDCTSCRYCLPCEKKIDIPTVIKYINELTIYDKAPGIYLEYGWMNPRFASTCIDCKKCEEKCPQHLPISDIMKRAAEEFGK